jgi:(1->4)-alpha-D-glucan 1-alpha-D-glucosylmutase
VDFGFPDAAAVVPYLHQLGISDLYASPCLQASPGSEHGYDISDHNRLNPDLGNEADFARLAAELRHRGIGMLLDIVPNHMGIAESCNRWWMDLLENGRLSPFARYFDINWNSPRPELRGKVLLPILGDQFGRVLESGGLQLRFEEGRFRIHYESHTLPVSPGSSSLVLRSILGEMTASAETESEELAELASIVTALEHLPTKEAATEESVAEIQRESSVSRRRLLALQKRSSRFRRALGSILRKYNGHPGEPESFDALEQVLDAQWYRPAFWRVAAEEINYRRFFDVNHLAGIRVEIPEVFSATHRLILSLVHQGIVTGLRIDHIDGLLAPGSYLRELQARASQAPRPTAHNADQPVGSSTGPQATDRRLSDSPEARDPADGPPIYILVEKILTGDEELRPDWPVAGTVGYEFMNRLNGLYVAGENSQVMTEIYHQFIGASVDYDALAYERKKLILRVAMEGELTFLAYELDWIAERNRRFRDFTLGSFTDALRETIACFPVYRTYIDAFSRRVEATDAGYVEQAIRVAIRRNRVMNPSIFEFIRDILLLNWPEELDGESLDEHARFVHRFQQLTGSVMAKGVEDTGFYIYNRLVSLNEVGGDPDRFGYSPEELHQWIAGRAQQWPLTMNSATTHDTKRSEDVRARINVLSEIPELWRERVHRWREMNHNLLLTIDDEPVPDPNDEYLLYQTLVGSFPLNGLKDNRAISQYRDRILLYMEKATREAKRSTSWVNPNEAYDNALSDVITTLLQPPEEESLSEEKGDEKDSAATCTLSTTSGRPESFLRDLGDFVEEIAWFGMINSLSRTLVDLTAPGVPDLYQGREVWDFSLVDPDNRRPVNFLCLTQMLDGIRARLAEEPREEIAAGLMARWRDGAVKMYVTHLALLLRKEMPELLTHGKYLPLAVEGAAAEHLFAFARVRVENAGTVGIARTEGITGTGGLTRTDALADLREAVVVVVPRLSATLTARTGINLTNPAVWSDTLVKLPADMGDTALRNVFTGERFRGNGLRAMDLFASFPVALLTTETDSSPQTA